MILLRDHTLALVLPLLSSARLAPPARNHVQWGANCSISPPRMGCTRNWPAGGVRSLGAGLGILNEHAAMLPGPDLCVQQGTDNGCTTVLAGVQARSGPTPSALADLATRPGGLSGRRRTHWWGRTGGQAACAVALTAPNNGRAPTVIPAPPPRMTTGSLKVYRKTSVLLRAVCPRSGYGKT